MTVTPQHSTTTKLRSYNLVWFIALCALLGALWSLNLVPQGSLRFHLRTTVVVSSGRLYTLQSRIHSAKGWVITNGGEAPADQSCLAVNILQQKAIRQANDQPGLKLRSPESLPNLHLVELHTIWPRQVTHETVKAWLEQLTKPTKADYQESKLARQIRWLEYRAQLAKQYQKNDISRTQLLAANEVGDTLSAVAFANHSQDTSSSSPEVTTANNQISANSVESLEQEIAALRKQMEVEEQKRIGTLSFSTISDWQPFVSSQPLMIPLLGLFLGTLCGIMLAILVRTRNMKRLAYANHFHSLLKENNIPLYVISRQPNYDDGRAPKSLLQRSRITESLSRVDWWITGCEWSLLCWGTIAACRFIIDPMWRSLIVSQPLAALARLFIAI